MTVLIFFLVLSVLVLIHELGHFLVARKNGVWVEEFGFGLPPRIYSKKFGETLYSVNLLPFGGFVKLHGENSEEGVSIPERAFINKGKKSRIAIIVAGVLMNFALAIVAFGIVYSFNGITKDTGEVRVVEISASSPAQTAGLLVGDVIKRADGEGVKSVPEFIEVVEKNKGERTSFEILRGEENLKLTITPRAEPPEGEGPLGVTISSTEVYYPPILLRPFYGIYYGFIDALFWGKTVFLGIISIFTDLFSGNAPKDLAGPVGIYAVTSEAAKFGPLAVINLMGILSINLAILNILPFPALDGGRLLFIGIETVLRRKVTPKIESAIHTVGMIILLLAIFAITAGDIGKIIKFGGISGFLESVTK